MFHRTSYVSPVSLLTSRHCHLQGIAFTAFVERCKVVVEALVVDPIVSVYAAIHLLLSQPGGTWFVFSEISGAPRNGFNGWIDSERSGCEAGLARQNGNTTSTEQEQEDGWRGNHSSAGDRYFIEYLLYLGSIAYSRLPATLVN